MSQMNLAPNGLYLPDTAYVAASQTSQKLRNWLPGRGSADADLYLSHDMLVRRSRDAYRNIPIATGAIDRIVENAIGSGLKLQIRIDRQKLPIEESQAVFLERDLESRFDSWAEDCDFLEMASFDEQQSIALTNMLSSGDIFVNTIYNANKNKLLLQLLEADQVCNPHFVGDYGNLRNGVEIDNYGRPVAYHVMTNHPGDIFPIWEWKRVPIHGETSNTRRIFHILNIKRPQQHRGIPFLSPIMEMLKLVERYTDAELVAAVISSYLTVMIKKTDGTPFSQEENPSGYGAKDLLLGPGAVITLGTNEDATTINPSRPNTAFPFFMSSILEQIGAGLSIPKEFLILAFNSSYSAARAAMLQAWIPIMYYRNKIINRFCRPIFKLWMEAEGIPQNVQTAIKTIWVGPARGSIDEEKEVRAAEKRIALGLSTRQKECEEMTGTDWLDNTNQLGIEEAERIKKGLPTTDAVIKMPVPMQETEEEDDDDNDNDESPKVPYNGDRNKGVYSQAKKGNKKWKRKIGSQKTTTKFTQSDRKH